MKLDDWLTENPKKAVGFADRIGVTEFALRRYRTGERIPKKPVMLKIVTETRGAVLPNDYYNIPPRFLPAAAHIVAAE